MNLPPIDLIRYKCLRKGEYRIDDMLFHIPSFHDLGRPLDSPLDIGSIIPVGACPNQSFFIYMSLDEPHDILLKNHLKEKFCTKIEYLSYPELV